ncbi:DKNYY domain-containing protein [Aquimarina sp. M1]
MKTLSILIFLLPFLSFAQKIDTLKIQEPLVDNLMEIKTTDCIYIDDEIYLLNENYIVYQNCTSRKLMYPDMSSFHFPVENENNYFALDKNGIYYRGTKIKTDTTGFTVIDDVYKDGLYWKTKYAVYKNQKKIRVSDVVTFRAADYFGGYFVDKKTVYYRGKKVQKADPSTFRSFSSGFAFDKKHSYSNGKIVTFKDEKITRLNNYFYKTSKHILTENDTNFIEHPGIDVHTVKVLSNSYLMDKNNVYYRTNTLPVKKEDLKNVKVWEQAERVYLTDKKNVYFRNGIPQKGLDATTFGMLKNSNTLFDKNGIYKRDWNSYTRAIENNKLPFNYNTPISVSKTYQTDNYVVYENDVYDLVYGKLYKNLTSEQIANIDRLRNIDDECKSCIVIDKEFDYDYLYKANHKIYYFSEQTVADANSFEAIGGYLFKDINNVYFYKREKGLSIISGLNPETLEVFNGFIKNEDYLYLNYQKIIKSKNLEILSIFSGYRKQCSQDDQASSNYYLFKNIEGYWLVEISDIVTIRNLGNIHRNNWNSLLKKIITRY